MSVLGRAKRRVVGVVAGAVTAVLLAAAAPAAAHTALVSADPAEGARLASAPQQVTLTFNEPVSARLASIALSVNGENVGALSVRQGADSRSVVGVIATDRVPMGLGQVEWVASYRVTSDDGHPVEGTVTFQAPLLGADDASSSPPPTPSPEQSGPVGDDGPASEPRTSPGSVPGANGGGQSPATVAFSLLALSGLAIGGVLLVRARRQRSDW